MLAFDIMHRNTVLYSVEMTKKQPIVTRYTDNRAYLQFSSDTPTTKEVMDWLEERCFPRTRANKDEILKDLGLKEYDPIDIIRCTHGLLYDDYIWVRWKGEQTDYNDIKIRD